eukprot:scaffold13029_cov68-Cyclotella_meneghiniana.AAC.1
MSLQHSLREEKMKLKQPSASKSYHITAPNPKDIVPKERRMRTLTNKVTEETPQHSLIGGPFDDTSGSKCRKDEEEELESAKEKKIPTGAPAFQNDYQENEKEDDDEMMNNPYTTLQSERIPPSDTLLDSSYFMRKQNGKEEYEMQAIGHDGMAADDIDKVGGHYQTFKR